MTSTPPGTRRIGEIADLTGMTVRTLRYYEEIGLLEPESRTDAGHRLYGADAVERLYRISLLRRLGLPLPAVRAGLDATTAPGGHNDDDGDTDPDAVDLRALLTDHLASVESRLTATTRLRSRLVQLVGSLESIEDTTGVLLSVLEDMAMLETTVDRRIAILVYDDIEAAHDHLVRVFGFGPGSLSRSPDGEAVHGEIHAGDGEFWLHPASEEFGLASPNTLGGATGTMAIMVDDVDAHHRFAVEQGATIRYEPVDQPYGYREYGAIDIGGHLWSFMKALE